MKWTKIIKNISQEQDKVYLQLGVVSFYTQCAFNKKILKGFEDKAQNQTRIRIIRQHIGVSRCYLHFWGIAAATAITQSLSER